MPGDRGRAPGDRRAAPETLVRYQVRTPMVLWMGNGVLTAFCVLVVGALVMFDNVPGMVLLLALILCSVTAAFWVSMSAYRVGGGRNLIRIYPDRIEVPHVRVRAPMVFTRDDLQLTITDVKVRYRVALTPIATVNRGKVIKFESRTAKRQLSTLVLADRHDETALVSDLERFVAGEPALGRAAYDAPTPRTQYDDRLDRELAQLD